MYFSLKVKSSSKGVIKSWLPSCKEGVRAIPFQNIFSEIKLLFILNLEINLYLQTANKSNLKKKIFADIFVIINCIIYRMFSFDNPLIAGLSSA